MCTWYCNYVDQSRREGGASRAVGLQAPKLGCGGGRGRLSTNKIIIIILTQFNIWMLLFVLDIKARAQLTFVLSHLKLFLTIIIKLLAKKSESTTECQLFGKELTIATSRQHRIAIPFNVYKWRRQHISVCSERHGCDRNIFPPATGNYDP